jgi:hypothetical protein
MGHILCCLNTAQIEGESFQICLSGVSEEASAFSIGHGVLRACKCLSFGHERSVSKSIVSHDIYVLLLHGTSILKSSRRGRAQASEDFFPGHPLAMATETEYSQAKPRKARNRHLIDVAGSCRSAIFCRSGVSRASRSGTFPCPRSFARQQAVMTKVAISNTRRIRELICECSQEHNRRQFF